MQPRIIENVVDLSIDKISKSYICIYICLYSYFIYTYIHI